MSLKREFIDMLHFIINIIIKKQFYVIYYISYVFLTLFLENLTLSTLMLTIKSYDKSEKNSFIF